MDKRYVTETGKNKAKDILCLCNGNEEWSPRSTTDAIYDIENNIFEYVVNWKSVGETTIRVVKGNSGKYLRTDRDDTQRNNLDDLPDCDC